MQLRHVTIIVTGVMLIGFTIYDSVVAVINEQATLSAITAQWAIKHTISVFCVGMILGIILGHLFWYQQIKIP